MAKKLVEECAEFARLSQSRVYENLSFRANVIAYLKAMVLFVASGEKWDKTVENFIRWSLQYDLWCKMRFFGQDIELAESAASNVKRGRVQNMLDSLPEIFTRGELISLRKKMGINKGDTNTVLRQWKHRGYIIRFDECAHNEGAENESFRKTQKYLSRFENS